VFSDCFDVKLYYDCYCQIFPISFPKRLHSGAMGSHLQLPMRIKFSKYPVLINYVLSETKWRNF